MPSGLGSSHSMPTTIALDPARTRTRVGRLASAPALGSTCVNRSAISAACHAGSSSTPSMATLSTSTPARNCGGRSVCALAGRASSSAASGTRARTAFTAAPGSRSSSQCPTTPPLRCLECVLRGSSRLPSCTMPLLPSALQRLTRDAWLLFATRFIRLFAYGALSVVLVFYLVGLGLSESQTGLLLTSTLIGDTVVSLYLTTRADRIGRRRMLIIGATLMAAAGLVFASTGNWWLLLLAGTIGVISPSGHEVGPFLSIEQAALAHVVTDRTRTGVFAWYTLAGSLATALGALVGGTIARVLQQTSMPSVSTYRVVVMLYAALGVILAALFAQLS